MWTYERLRKLRCRSSNYRRVYRKTKWGNKKSVKRKTSPVPSARKTAKELQVPARVQSPLPPPPPPAEEAQPQPPPLDQLLLALAVQVPHAFDNILSHLEALDLARCLRVSRSLRRAVSLALQSPGMHMRAQMDESCMRLAARRDNGFLYLSYGEQFDSDYKLLIDLDYGPCGPKTPRQRRNKKKGGSAHKKFFVFNPDDHVINVPPSAMHCTGVDGIYFVVDTDLDCVAVLQDSGEVRPTVWGPQSVAKRLRGSVRFNDLSASKEGLMEDWRVHYLGDSPPGCPEERNGCKNFLLRNEDDGLEPVEVPAAPCGTTFRVGRFQTYPSAINWSRNRDNQVVSGPALVPLPCPYEEDEDDDLSPDEEEVMPLRMPEEPEEPPYADQVLLGGELGPKVPLPVAKRRHLGTVVRSEEDPSKLLSVTTSELILTDFSSGDVLWKCPLLPEETEVQNCNECIANTKSTKEIALADAKDVKVAFITSHFAGAVFVLTRPTEEDEETVTVSLAYVIVDVRNGYLLHRGEEPDLLGLKSGELMDDRSSEMHRLPLVACGRHLCFTAGSENRGPKQWDVICARVDREEDGSEGAGACLCTCRRLRLPMSAFYLGCRHRGCSGPLDPSGVSRLFGLYSERVVVGSVALTECVADRTVVFCLDLDLALSTATPMVYTGAGGGSLGGGEICHRAVWMPMEHLKTFPAAGERYFNDLRTEEDFDTDTIWPIYKTDSGRMELEGVLERPFKRAEVNALRVWRFCKRLRCTELEE